VAGRKPTTAPPATRQSWKVGATWNTGFDGWRVRAVTSKDVRAPNLSGTVRRAGGGQRRGQLQRATPVGRSSSARSATPSLRPEIARNTVFGAGAEPAEAWLPGFSASIDYFDIKVKGVISSWSPQQEVDLCVAGNQEICSAWCNRPAATNNYVTVQAFNLASLRSKGYDMEAGLPHQA
jgi:iron complex outermembrane receptor protein